jgi:phosphatidylinositol alpha-1,6-mannosyltransferase
MRVLVVTPDYPPEVGGIQILTYRLVSELRHLRPRVLTLEAEGAEQFDRQAAHDVVRMRLPGFGHRAEVAALNVRATSMARSWRADVVLSMHIALAPGTCLARQLYGTQFVQYLYAKEILRRPRLAQLAVRRAAATVAISAHTEELAFRCGARPRSVHRIHPGVDVPETLRRAPDSQPTLITVARLRDRHKGHDAVMRAVARLRSKIPEIRWIVIGDGPLRKEYEDLARRLGVDRHVRFVGRVSDAERDEWLAKSHVFVMPSRDDPTGSEGFGIVYLEAAAHGLPVVASDRAGVLDAVVHGRTGLLVNPSDDAALARALEQLLLDPALAEQLGRAGYERAREFSWNRAAGRLEGLLRDVAGASR